MAPEQGHELIEHTADVGLRVWASSLDALFAEAAIGLVDVMGKASSSADRSEQVSLEAPDLDALFVDWLSEILFLFDGRGFVSHSVEANLYEEPWRVEATLHGSDAGGFEQHGPAVKAVTYHALEIRRTPGGYEAYVYLDV